MAAARVVDGTWDATYDVVVAGYGYSGGMAAVAAADAGSTVAIFEKATHPGGNSVLSGGSCVFGLDYDDTLAYMRATCDGNTDDEILQAFAAGMLEIPELLTKLANDVGMDTYREPRGDAAYPLPGGQTLRSMRVTRNERYEGLEWVTGPKAGATLFFVLMENVRQREAIDVVFDAPVTRLIADDGEVVGCVVEQDGVQRRIRARQAVVLCTGGFEHDRRMIRHFIGSAPTVSVSPLGNTGDGIRMGQELGGALWHTWHLHGGYGFRIPETPVAIRHSCTGARKPEHPMPWILVNRQGVRFMNEYPPAPQDTPIRDMLRFDADLPGYPNIPAFMVFDEDGRAIRPLGSPVMTDPSISYEWSEDNLAEVDKGYIVRADTLAELADAMGIDAERFEATVAAWNAACQDGGDPTHLRPQWTMMPIARPPFYCIEAHPIITNTQGGLVHDASQRVLTSFGDPIPRLYKAGENGSLFGHLYLLGGNNSECFIGGRIAGRNAAAESRR